MKRKGTYYEILEVQRDATLGEIKKAFRRLAKIYHPDVNPSPTAHDEFRAISEAYEVLSNPELRERYNRFLGEQEGRDTSRGGKGVRTPSGPETQYNKCAYCGIAIIDHLPFKCHHCGKIFCYDHRFPENHYCQGIYYKEPEPVSHRCYRCGKRIPRKYNYCGDCIKEMGIDIDDEEGTKVETEEPESTTKRDSYKIVLILAAMIILLYGVYLVGLELGLRDAAVSTISTSTLTTTSLVLGTTSTFTISTISLKTPEGCWEYCKQISPEQMGACMKKHSDCYPFGWKYYPDGNTLCPRTTAGLSTFCCCGGDKRFLSLLDNETCPKISDPVLKTYLENTPQITTTTLVRSDFSNTYKYVEMCQKPSNMGDQIGAVKYKEDSVTCKYVLIKQESSYSTTTTTIKLEYVTSEYDTSKDKPNINSYSFEKQIHELINIERAKYGKRQLYYDSKLSSVARKHSQDMAEQGYFSHTNQQEEDPTARASAEGYRCHKDYGRYYTEGIAENIAQDWLYSTEWVTPGGGSTYEWYTLEGLSQSIAQGWMNSPGHRQNILDKNFDKEGIGVAITKDHKVYVTQDFC